MNNSVVKSTAIVKREPFPVPQTFKQLDPETNLHKPPENWLRERISVPLPSNVTGFPALTDSTDDLNTKQLQEITSSTSSLSIANYFLDQVGDVDVIAHADVVKKLMRLTLDKRQLSIVAHRIGNTLLLDEFDVLAMLIATEEREWQWIRDFVRDHISQDLEDRNLNLRRPYHKGAPATLERNMISKFLHRSVPKMLGSQQTFDQEPIVTPPAHNEVYQLPQPAHFDPKQPSESSNASVPEVQSRTVLWEFDDMQMLLGSNLPIFGGANHPVVSLRLHDATKPINVLTGLDYWLDNLICNVPELAMCYHINGIVQKYEVHKTMDIPDLPNTKFSPTVVRDIAQNILSFLNNKCTKEGHTYWLFKAHNDEIVKLYDLTSICDQRQEGDSQNPFAIPVAFLLYRVAKNLVSKFSEDAQRSSKVRATVFTLLRNSLKLIQESSSSTRDTYKDLEACIYFLLVQLFVPSGQWRDWASSNQNGDIDDESGSETSSLAAGGEDESELNFSDHHKPNGTEEDDSKGWAVDEVSVKKLMVKGGTLGGTRNRLRECRQAHDYVHVGLTVEERCKSGLDYVLNCLKYLNAPSSERLFSGSSTPSDNLTLATCEPLIGGLAWRKNIEKSLFYKLAVILSTLGLQCFESGTSKLGRAFRYVKFALAACCAIPNEEKSQCESNDIEMGGPLEWRVVQLLGDVLVMVAMNISQLEIYIEQITSTSVTEAEISKYLLPNDSPMYQKVESMSLCGNPQKLFDFALQLYNMCLEHASPSSSNASATNHTGASNSYKAKKGVGSSNTAAKSNAELLKRLGNVNNELGKIYENQLMESSSDSDLEALEEVKERSKGYLEQSLAHFRAINDGANCGLVLTNLARLYRIWAHMLSEEKEAVQPEEKNQYFLAIENYKQALFLLEKTGDHALCNNVAWDLSSTFFSLGQRIQDATPVSNNRTLAQTEVIELLSKALKYCPERSKLPKESVPDEKMTGRKGDIHQRLGSLYHSCYRADPESQQSLISLAHFNYDQAIFAYKTYADVFSESLAKVFLEQAALYECQALADKNWKLCWKHLKLGLEKLQSALPLVGVVNEGESDLKLSDVFFKQTQRMLLNMYKSISSQNNTINVKLKDKLTPQLKALYAKSLKAGKDLTTWKSFFSEISDIKIS